MRIGVVSDTHGHTTNAQRAVRMLESCEVELVIHCGDIGTVEVVKLFKGLPTHFVFGNTDYDRAALRQAIKTAGLQCHETFGSIECSGRRIAFLHGDDFSLLRSTVDSGDWDLVCHGHTHQAGQEQLGNTLVLNPGALYRANPHTVAMVQLPQLEAAHIAV